MSAKLMAAEASGDPLMAKHATLLNRVQNLRMEQSSYLDNVRSARMELAGIPARIAGYQNDIKQGEKSRAIVDRVTAVQFVGDERTLILEKNGKEIAEGLVAALKSSFLSDPKGEEKLNILVAGSHEENEVKEIVDKKEKKVKKITFHPLPVQMYMAERALSPSRPQLVLTGDILSEQRDLADIEFTKKGAIKSYEIKANVSRTFTEYVNRRAHEDKWYKETIEGLKEKEPKLKSVAETPWDKQEEFEQKLKELEDVEREMAERGNVAGRPELGMKIEHYEAPVPAVDDIAPKESWRTYALAKAPYNFPIGDQTVYWPNSGGHEPPFAFRTQAPLKDFARNRTGKVEAQFAETYNLPEDIQLLSGPPLADKPAVKPYGFTTIDNKTRFWIPIDKGKAWVTVDPTQWNMLERIVPEGSWHFEGGRMSGDFLVHIDSKGQRDAFIRAQRENASDIPAGFKDYKPPEQKGTPSFILLEPPPMYSMLQRVIETKMGKSMPVNQLEALLKQPGIKKDEIRWTGLDDFLAEKKDGKVTKAEVLQFLKDNELKIQEVTKGRTGQDISLTPEQFKTIETALLDHYPENEVQGETGEIHTINEWIHLALAGDFEALSLLEYAVDSELLKPIHEGTPLFQEGGRTKFEKWSLPGGKNYRELLFTLPSRGEERGTDTDIMRYHDVSQEYWTSLSETQREEMRQEYKEITRGKEPAGFRGAHWDEPNVLAHVRFDERTDSQGNPVLFIEEIQSDWHKAGKKRGYNTPRPTIADVQIRPFEDRFAAWLRDVRIAGGMTEDEARRNAERILPTLDDERLEKGVPPAPFAKTWHEFVLKRMIQYAAAHGFDRIAWTTGDQQADRYNLSQAVTEIGWEKAGEDHEGNEIVTLQIVPKRGDQEELYNLIKQRTGVHWDTDEAAGPILYVPVDKLENILGKDMTKRILENKAESGLFEGEDLKIGGEGMEGFYDKIIPDYLNKFGKKWGARVEDLQLQTGKESVYGQNEEGEDYDAGILRTVGLSTEEKLILETVHSLPITQAMKDTAMKEGFPLFNDRAKGWDKVEGEAQPRPTERELNQISALVSRIAGSHAVFQNTLEVNLRDPQTQIGLKKHGWTAEEIQQRIDQGYTVHRVAGSMSPVLTSPNQWRALIHVAVGGSPAWRVQSRALHEAFEAVRDFMLTPEEKELLDQVMPGRNGKSASEVQAYAFGDYFTEAKGVLIPKTAKGFFDRIKAFFIRLKNYINGLGFQTAEDIFERAASGEIKREYREGKVVTAKEASLKPAKAFKLDDLQSLLDIVEGHRKDVYKDIRTDREHKWDPYANVARSKVLDRMEAGLKSGRSPEQIFSPLKAEARKELAKSQQIGANSYDEVARLKMIEALEKDIRKAWPFGQLPAATAFTLDPETQKNMDALKSPDLAQKAQEDKGFKAFIKQIRFGLVKITDPDLKNWERILSLPYWLQDKYRELRPLVKTQMNREEARSQTIHDLVRRANDFFTLKGEQLANVEKAIVAGDRGNKVFDEDTLRKQFNLDTAGIRAYRATRDTLDLFTINGARRFRKTSCVTSRGSGGMRCSRQPTASSSAPKRPTRSRAPCRRPTAPRKCPFRQSGSISRRFLTRSSPRRINASWSRTTSRPGTNRKRP